MVKFKKWLFTIVTIVAFVNIFILNKTPLFEIGEDSIYWLLARIAIFIILVFASVEYWKKPNSS